MARLPRAGAAGIDVGATKTHMRYVPPGGSEPEHVTLRTNDYGSLEELLEAAFTAAGCLPSKVVGGAAGPVQPNGDFQMTNRPWPLFRHKPFVERLGISLRLVNDIYPVVASIEAVDASSITALTPDVEHPATKARVVAALGSGVGVAYMDAVDGIHPSEIAHTTWQPVTEVEHALLAEMQQELPGRVVTIEEAIGGLEGFDRMYSVVSKRVEPSAEVRSAVEAMRAEGEPVGPAVSTGALDGDECCLAILDLYGSLLGQLLRNVALATLIEKGGAIYLSGSVMQRNKGAQMVVGRSVFRDRFVSEGAKHAELMKKIPIYLLTDDHAAVKGSFRLANA